MNFHGVITALVTPFKGSSAEVDYTSLEKLIEWQIEKGVQGLLICGSTGESSQMSADEYSAVVKKAVEIVKGRLPLISGIGASGTKLACNTASFCKEVGIDGLLVVAPPYCKPSQEGIFQHFSAIYEAAGLPVLAYNNPTRAAIDMEADTVVRLSQQKLIVGIKEASGSIDRVMELRSKLPTDFALLAGDCAMAFPVYACGGEGVISASANVLPQQFVDVYSKASSNEFAASREEHLALLPKLKLLFSERNPIVVKQALAQMGIIAEPTVRLPLTSASEQTVQAVKEVF